MRLFNYFKKRGKTEEQERLLAESAREREEQERIREEVALRERLEREWIAREQRKGGDDEQEQIVRKQKNGHDVEKKYDIDQQRAINAHSGYYLVLAPPGCGKTDILAERIVRAKQNGVNFEEMLCLTFTNRAARGMLDRVKERVGEDSCDIFVGNVHRYCSVFLYGNELVPQNSTIIDDDDMADILDYEADKWQDKEKVSDIDNIAAYISQRDLGHPDSAIFLPKSEYEKFYQYAVRVNFSPEEVDSLRENLLLQCQRYNEQCKVKDICERLQETLYLCQYKLKHNMISFSDLLVKAYECLRNDKDHRFKRYKWIQVDEAQDLNALQIAIIDELLDHSGDFTVMYLGDEQQAIYSFLGAKREQLGLLKQRCNGNIMSLGINYRSPKYLLDVFNTYAEEELKFDPDLLPKAVIDAPHDKRDLMLIENEDEEDELETIVDETMERYRKNENERVALLVHSNKKADNISDKLSSEGIPNFKISGQDMFKSKTYKTLSSFLQVCVNNFNLMAWAHLLYGIGAVKTMREARELIFVKLKNLMMTPMDLLQEKSYIARFNEEYRKREFVFFDTETTGLNVNEDDIVQIAAFKVKCGVRVPGSDFNLFIHTDKPIPQMLGDIVNPLMEAYANNPHYNREDGLRMFLNYVGDRPVLGHNVDYDYNILRKNVERTLGEEIALETYDSLKLIKYVEPNLRKYKLKYLLEELHLQGENSHLADDDVAATKSVVDYCCRHFLPEREQEEAVSQEELKRIVDRTKTLLPLFNLFQKHAYDPIKATDFPMADMLDLVYRYMKDTSLIEESDKKEFIDKKKFIDEKKFNLFLQYIRNNWRGHDKKFTLFDLLYDQTRYLVCMNEGDLVNSEGLVQDKVFVMTPWKAKGLEFENVIVLDAIDDYYPFYKVNEVLKDLRNHSEEEVNKAKQDREESARVFYVAISRARKRLYVSYVNRYVSAYGNVYPKKLTPFMSTIRRYFFIPSAVHGEMTYH